MQMSEFYTEDKIQSLFDKHKVPRHIRIHGKATADLSVKIVRALNEKGYALDEAFTYFAACLHDIARVHDRHAAIGAKWLEEAGYIEVAEVILEHMDKKLPDLTFAAGITESHIVYLADKLMKEDRLVSISERYAPAFEKMKGYPEAIAHMKRKVKEQAALKEYLEKIICIRIEDLAGIKNL